MVLAVYTFAALGESRKRIVKGTNTSSNALMATGRKAKRGLPPRSQAAPLTTETTTAVQ
jgi:hypothetical protein